MAFGDGAWAQTIGFTMEIMRFCYDKSSKTIGFTLEIMRFFGMRNPATSLDLQWKNEIWVWAIQQNQWIYTMETIGFTMETWGFAMKDPAKSFHFISFHFISFHFHFHVHFHFHFHFIFSPIFISLHLHMEDLHEQWLCMSFVGTWCSWAHMLKN